MKKSEIGSTVKKYVCLFIYGKAWKQLAQIATVAAVFVAFLTWFTNFDFLVPIHLQAAEIVFSEETIVITRRTDTFDAMQATLYNAGEATATNIKFRVYATRISNNSTTQLHYLTVVPLFKEEIINELYSNSRVKIPEFYIEDIERKIFLI
jgi:hypothetical protein